MSISSTCSRASYPPNSHCRREDTPPCQLSYDRPNYACDMLKRFDHLRRDSCLVDAVLCVGNAELPCHRAVLAAISAYFRAMFSADMRESRQLRVKFSDVLASTLEVSYPARSLVWRPRLLP